MTKFLYKERDAGTQTRIRIPIRIQFPLSSLARATSQLESRVPIGSALTMIIKRHARPTEPGPRIGIGVGVGVASPRIVEAGAPLRQHKTLISIPSVETRVQIGTEIGTEIEIQIETGSRFVWPRRRQARPRTDTTRPPFESQSHDHPRADLRATRVRWSARTQSDWNFTRAHGSRRLLDPLARPARRRSRWRENAPESRPLRTERAASVH